jgi:hypothetical protein
MRSRYPGVSYPAGGKGDVWAEVDVCQLLREGSSSALLNTSPAVHHKIFVQPALIESLRLDGSRDAVVTLDVAHFLAALHVPADDLIAAYRGPDAAHLVTPVSFSVTRMTRAIVCLSGIASWLPGSPCCVSALQAPRDAPGLNFTA